MKKILAIVFPIILFVLNLWLVWPLSQGGYSQYFGSIESVFLADAKFIVQNFPHINFYPFWYFGFPFYLTYQPVVPFGLALVNFLTHLPLEASYRLFSGLAYAFGGVGFYFLASFLTKNKIAAFLAALLYSFMPSIGYLIGEVRGMGEVFSFLPWRLVVLMPYGEGPHIWGLALTPLAILFTIRLLRQPSRANWLGAIFSIVAILLTSLTAFVAVPVWLFFVFVAEVGVGERKKRFFIFLILILFILGLAAFWYNLSFIKAALLYAESEGGGLVAGFFKKPAMVSLLLPLTAIFVLLISPFLKRPNFAPWFMGFGSFILLLVSIYFWYHFRLAIIPLPFRSIPRLIPELEMAFALTLAVCLAFILRKLKGFHQLLPIVVTLCLVIILGIYIPSRQKAFWKLTAAHPDYAQTSEYRIAQWLRDNTHGERVYATGTHAFWLNVFADVPQLRGGKGGDFGGLNILWAHLNYQLYYGDDGQLAVDWLRALGIKYLVVNFPESKVTYHDFQHPYKFGNLTKQVYKYQGDVIYEAPTKHTGLVAVAKKEQLDNVGVFWNAKEGKAVLDKEKLARYLEATESSPDFTDLAYEYQAPWTKMVIKAPDLGSSQAILVRISYHPGWRAFQNSQRLEIKKDPLGFMVITPRQSGEIVLQFRPTFDVYFGYLITLATLIILIIFLGGASYKR